VIILFYRVFLWLYKVGALLLSPWNQKARYWVQGRRYLLEKIEKELSHPDSGVSGNEVLWMHCASLGEYEQGRPVLEKLRGQYPRLVIIITFFSPSGYQQVINNHKGVANFVYYLPADSYRNAEKLLDIFKPALVLWVKYEYWYFYLREIRQRNIPLLLVSGIFRNDQPFFKWYGSFHKRILSSFTCFFVQNQSSSDLLGSIGISGNIAISGDTRFDRVMTIREQFSPVPLIEKFISAGNEEQNVRIIVAGSTWEEDEEELAHFANSHPEIKFIIAPHDVQKSRIEEVKELFKTAVLFSDWQEKQKGSSGASINPHILVIDNIGMLSKLYKYATIAYVGGGFGDDGVHNVLEAAVYEKPVVFGPEFEKYREAIELVNSGGGFSIENALELESVFNELLDNEPAYEAASRAAGGYVNNQQGASAIITYYIQEKRLLTS
jgi:3-deoxy-D-manno-octulosonic-acid transferase